MTEATKVCDSVCVKDPESGDLQSKSRLVFVRVREGENGRRVLTVQGLSVG